MYIYLTSKSQHILYRPPSHLLPLAYTQRYYDLLDAADSPLPPRLRLTGAYTAPDRAGEPLDLELPLQDPAPDLCPRALLSRVQVARALSGAQLVACVRTLAAEAARGAASNASTAAGTAMGASPLACVVVDSVAVHFRAEREGRDGAAQGELNALAKVS